MSKKAKKRSDIELLIEEVQEEQPVRDFSYYLNSVKNERQQGVNFVNAVPSMTPEEYKKRLDDGDFVKETDVSESDLINIKTILVEIVKKYPVIWDWEKLGFTRNTNQSATWTLIGIDMYEEFGSVFSLKTLSKWWRYLKESYRRQLYRMDENGKELESKWRHYDSMHFIRHTLERSCTTRRRTLGIEVDEKQDRDENSIDSEDDDIIFEQPPVQKKSRFEGYQGGSPQSMRSQTVESESSSVPPPQFLMQQDIAFSSDPFVPSPGDSTPISLQPPPPQPQQQPQTPVTTNRELEQWERDAEYIRDEVIRHFRNIKEDPTKLLEAKRKMLNCLWAMESSV